MLVEILKTVPGALRSLVQSCAALLAENLVFRQQIIVLQRSVVKPRFRARDRVVLALAARLFSSALNAATIVRPETVVRWHRSLWRLIWRRKSQRPVGRPPADADLRALMRRFWTENPLWGENRIAAELGKLGYDVSPRTVAKYRPPHLPRTRGQRWSTFVRHHLHQTWACDGPRFELGTFRVMSPTREARRSLNSRDFRKLHTPRVDGNGHKKTGADGIRSSFVPHEGRSSFWGTSLIPDRPWRPPE